MEVPPAALSSRRSHCGVQQYASFRGISDALHLGLSGSRLREGCPTGCDGFLGIVFADIRVACLGVVFFHLQAMKCQMANSNPTAVLTAPS
jgi:hypothetical protein